LNKKVIITADSPSDISLAFQQQKGIDEIVPLHIVLGDDVYDDGSTISVDEMLSFYDKTGTLPKTSAVSIAEYNTVFQKYPAEEYDVVHFSLSSKISATHYNAVLASKNFENVYVIDSEALSLTIALMVLDACDMRGEGRAAQEIYDYFTQHKAKYKTAFIIDSLEFLHKGGRCSSLTALGANVLKIKPCIVMENGSLSVGKKYRGKLELCQMQYLKDRIELLGDALDKKRMFIGYTSGMNPKQLETIQKEVKRYGFREVNTLQVGCTITAHCGKNTFAVYIKEK
jgi:DegV family protein with EDD domain